MFAVVYPITVTGATGWTSGGGSTLNPFSGPRGRVLPCRPFADGWFYR